MFQASTKQSSHSLLHPQMPMINEREVIEEEHYGFDNISTQRSTGCT